MADEKYYIVRGAKMVCEKGSNERHINLPNSHGSYASEKPMMNKKDNIVEKNIKYFGVCKGDCPSGDGDIAVIDMNGNNAVGKKCQVKILKEWMKTKEDTLVSGEDALTTDSFLVCEYDGKITFVTTGQED
ncbi:UNVERIFIED_ORG: hypothetical protein B2H98_06515 [Clostridium botulinum]